MARAITHRRLVQMFEQFEPPIRDAFLAAFQSISDRASIAAIADLLAAGRVDDVLTVLGIDSASLAPLTESVRAAYVAGGTQAAAEVPTIELAIRQVITGAYAPKTVSPRMRFSFDIRNPAAERWLSNHAANLVTSIIEDQRNAIRETLAAGLQAGRNPRQTALDIAGRVGETGRRSGGIVGLTEQQARFVANARAELASGDRDTMARYFTRERRDRRFDAAVRKAMAEGKPLSAADLDKITGRYADRLLALRAENIARTESMAAISAAREQSFRQAVAAGDLDPQHVRKKWGATGDSRTRDSHRRLNGTEIGLEEAFQSPTGARMRYPGDTELGASARDVAGCRCTAIYRIDMLAATMGRRR